VESESELYLFNSLCFPFPSPSIFKKVTVKTKYLQCCQWNPKAFSRIYKASVKV